LSLAAVVVLLAFFFKRNIAATATAKTAATITIISAVNPELFRFTNGEGVSFGVKDGELDTFGEAEG
jgi:hypothetical protein